MSNWAWRTPTADEWREILEKHARWTRSEPGGERADLRGADLRRANLQGAYLRGAYLQGAYLQGAYLQGAYLQGADLRRADLLGADLRSADLQGADLRGADLQGADLRGADLRDANLRGADLRDADLRDANLQGAKDTELVIARTRILPDGDLIGWKKCRGGVIVKLRISAEAKRSHAFGRKCRAEYADVLEVIGGEVGVSLHDRKTEYRVGQRVTPDTWDADWTQECSSGLHFYITRAEAEAHS